MGLIKVFNAMHFYCEFVEASKKFKNANTNAMLENDCEKFFNFAMRKFYFKRHFWCKTPRSNYTFDKHLF